jgi:hypothetical protein
VGGGNLDLRIQSTLVVRCPGLGRSPKAVRTLSVDGGHGPNGEGFDDGVGESAGPLHDGGGRTDLADHRRHPCFTQNGQGHALYAVGRDPERGGSQGLQEFGQTPTSGRLVAVPAVVRGRTTRPVGVEPEPDIRLDVSGVGRSRLQ